MTGRGAGAMEGMSPPPAPSERVRRAASITIEYALFAFHPENLRWSTEEILEAAESVWNNYEPGTDPAVLTDEPEKFAFYEALYELRHERWGDQTFFIFALDLYLHDATVTFTFDLMWPGESAIHPFEVPVDRARVAPVELN